MAAGEPWDWYVHEAELVPAQPQAFETSVVDHPYEPAHQAKFAVSETGIDPAAYGNDSTSTFLHHWKYFPRFAAVTAQDNGIEAHALSEAHICTAEPFQTAISL